MALVGVASGWLLGLASQLVLGWREKRSARKTAALLIYAELLNALGNLSGLRLFGVWNESQVPRRTAWEGYAPALLFGASLERVGVIAGAYNTIEDVADLVADGESDFRKGDDADFLDRQRQRVEAGLREVATLTGRSEKEIKEKFAELAEYEMDARRRERGDHGGGES